MEDTVESYLSITATFRRKKVAVVERWLLEKGLKKRRWIKNGEVAVNGCSIVYERGTFSVRNNI